MTKKKEQQPRGRPSKKQKEIFRDETDLTEAQRAARAREREAQKDISEAIKPKPEYGGVPVAEESLDLGAKQAEVKETGEKTICKACRGELDAEKKPRYCPNCGLELNWGG